jgi:hypothetical protein
MMRNGRCALQSSIEGLPSVNVTSSDNGRIGFGHTSDSYEGGVDAYGKSEYSLGGHTWAAHPPNLN